VALLVDTLVAISKIIPRGDILYFVSLDSHLQNTKSITEGFSDKFVSRRKLLVKASSIHDLLKAKTLNPNALTEKVSLFPRHTKLPDYLVDPSFNEFELDPKSRVRNWDNYYILNLVRLHHAGFNYDRLFDISEFFYEKTSSKHNFQHFVRDWYALMTADWLDSRIIELIFQAREIPSLVDMGVHSEVELEVKDEKCFRIVQEDILISKVRLCYDYIKASRNEILPTLKGKRRREKISALMSYLSDLEIESIEAELIEP
jgi:hypothetical protein